MLRRWLETPEVMRWWGDPAQQEDLLREDLAGDAMTMLIVCHGGRPFAFAQHCDVHDWPEPIYAHLPPETRAIDAMIGEPDMLGRGHGSAFLRVLADDMTRDGAKLIVIDPAVGNHRARRAYGRAGFEGNTPFHTREGTAVIMRFSGRR